MTVYSVLYRDPTSDDHPHRTHLGEIRWSDGLVELYDTEDGMPADICDPDRIIPTDALIRADRVEDGS